MSEITYSLALMFLSLIGLLMAFGRPKWTEDRLWRGLMLVMITVIAVKLSRIIGILEEIHGL